MKWIKKIDMSIRYEGITRFMVEVMLNLSVASLINITYGVTGSLKDIIAYSFACLTLLGILLLLFYTAYYPLKYYKQLVSLPDLHERHCFLFLEFRSSNIKCHLFYVYFLLRRLFFAFLLVCMKDFPHYQVTLILLINLWTFAYHVRLRPFKSSLQNGLACFNELVLLVFSSLLFLFLSADDLSRIRIGSFVCIGLILAFF